MDGDGLDVCAVDTIFDEVEFEVVGGLWGFWFALEALEEGEHAVEDAHWEGA